ncbi:MAG: helix-turn-helix domain-containing protein [Thermoplasmata archaeon]
MPTVTLEIPSAELIRLGLLPEGFFEKYSEVELLETLRLERGRRVQLLRIRRRGPLRPATQVERESARLLRTYGLERFELVERRPAAREYIVLVQQRNPELLRQLVELARGQIAPTAPFRIGPDRTVASFYGDEAPLRRVLGWLGRAGIPVRVVRTSARPARPPKPGLTPLQEELLARAAVLGYYSIPRRISLSRLAPLTGRSAPALGKILRRAEGRLVLDHLAGEGGLGVLSGPRNPAMPRRTSPRATAKRPSSERSP